jgi:hypothetical protein
MFVLEGLFFSLALSSADGFCGCCWCWFIVREKHCWIPHYCCDLHGCACSGELHLPSLTQLSLPPIFAWMHAAGTLQFQPYLPSLWRTHGDGWLRNTRAPRGRECAAFPTPSPPQSSPTPPRSTAPSTIAQAVVYIFIIVDQRANRSSAPPARGRKERKGEQRPACVSVSARPFPQPARRYQMHDQSPPGPSIVAAEIPGALTSHNSGHHIIT